MAAKESVKQVQAREQVRAEKQELISLLQEEAPNSVFLSLVLTGNSAFCTPPVAACLLEAKLKPMYC